MAKWMISSVPDSGLWFTWIYYTLKMVEDSLMQKHMPTAAPHEHVHIFNTQVYGHVFFEQKNSDWNLICETCSWHVFSSWQNDLLLKLIRTKLNRPNLIHNTLTHPLGVPNQFERPQPVDWAARMLLELYHGYVDPRQKLPCHSYTSSQDTLP